MRSQQELARIALRAAFDVRKKANLAFQDPICIYDAVENLGLEVWFVAGASFGGMYAKEYGRVFVPVERPAGRKTFTCAHEVAHWWFDHGTKIDDLDFDRSDHEIAEERLANIFAGYLLMPRHAVIDEFRRRKLTPGDCDSIEMYAVACQLGVGYETLIKHLRWSLNLLNHAKMQDLCAIPPKEIRRAIVGVVPTSHLVLVDAGWHKVAIDLEVGDIAVLPRKSRLCGTSAVCIGEAKLGQVVKGVRPGLIQALSEVSDWSAMVRVSRKNFAGRGAYRHLEDPDESE